MQKSKFSPFIWSKARLFDSMKLLILIPVFLLLTDLGCQIATAKEKITSAASEMGILNTSGVNYSGLIDTIPSVLKSFRNVHPRLYMTAQSQKILKSKMTSQPYAALLEKLKALADKAVLGGTPAYRPGSGYDEQLWQREVGNAIPELAMTYCMTGIIKYRDAARDYMLASASYPTWGIDAIDNTDLATGHQLYGIALGYDWLYNDLDDASRDSIRNCLIKRGGRLYDLLSQGKVWWHNGYLHNHQHVNLTGLATAGFALYGENTDVYG